MGSAVKKITRPVAKVLDKVIPNEIKPALPYLAAAAPFILPPGFGQTMFSSLGRTGSSMVARGLVGGGSNALSQLSQEGNEGDLSLGRVGLAALPAALSAPGAGKVFSGLQVPNSEAFLGENLGFMDSVRNAGLGALEKGSNFLSAEGGSGGVADILRPGGTEMGLNLATAGAASLPISQGAMEQGIMAAEKAKKEYERQYADWENFTGSQLADFNSGRRQAIIASMTAAQLDQGVIESTLKRLGLKDGGRVDMKIGGIPAIMSAGKVVGKKVMSEGKKMKNAVMDKLSRMTDDVEISMDSDYAEDTGASVNYLIKAKSGKGKETLDILVQEGFVDKADDAGNYLVRDFENASDSLSKLKASGIQEGRYDTGGKFIDDFQNFRKGPGEAYGPKGREYGYDEIYETFNKKANGGIMGYNMGGSVLPQGMEMDYRGGGFIPMGSKEKADDVPARVSKNEFVMTADAVRAAGGGSVNQGAKRMYDLMNNLEAKS